MGSDRKLLLLAAALMGITTPYPASAAQPCAEPSATLLVTGLQGASGSTIGPGGALFVTEGAAGRISRVDPKTGEVTTFASGLPPAIRRHRRGDRRRVHRQDRVRAGHPRRP